MSTPLEAALVAIVVIFGLLLLGSLGYMILSVQYTTWHRYGVALREATINMFHAEQCGDQTKLGNAKAALLLLMNTPPAEE